MRLFSLAAHTELAKKVCPRLRDIATAPAGLIAQPRTHFFGQLCTRTRGQQRYQIRRRLRFAILNFIETSHHRHWPGKGNLSFSPFQAIFSIYPTQSLLLNFWALLCSIHSKKSLSFTSSIIVAGIGRKSRRR